MEAGKRRSAQYNLLPAGTYEFHVIACNSDGIWNEKGATLKLRILPHFYETWWFQVLAGMGTLGIVAVAIRTVTLRRLRWKMRDVSCRCAPLLRKLVGAFKERGLLGGVQHWRHGLEI